MNRKIILSTVLLLSTALLFSCTEGGDDQGPTQIGNSIFVSNEAGSKVVVSMDFDADWSIANNSGWFVVTPRSGSAGPVDISVSVLDVNPNLKERVTSFDATCGDEVTTYYVIQEGDPGFNIEMPESDVSGISQNYTWVIESNVKYEAVPDADWVNVVAIEYDSVLLDDNITYSKYMTSRLTLAIDANDDGTVRTCGITLNGEDGVTADLSVNQIGQLSADFSRDFIRRSLAIKFTGTWCTNCPRMSDAIHGAMEDYPDHIVTMSMYDQSSDAPLRFSNYSFFASLCGVSNLPTGIVNFYSMVQSWSNQLVSQEIYVGLAHEATEELPANTMLGGMMTISSDSIFVNLSIAAKESGNYYLSMFLLEDSVVNYQAGSNLGNEYVHNYVARAIMTRETFGDPISLQGGEVTQITYKMRIPSSGIVDVNNLHVVASLSREGTYSGGSEPVTNALYGNIGYVLDNVSDFHPSVIVDFAYED